VGNDPEAIITQIMSSQPKDFSTIGIPTCVWKVVKHMMEKDPDHRYQSMQGVVHDFQYICDLFSRGIKDAPLDWNAGTNDEIFGLILPEKLYGREHELQELENTITGTDRPDILFISGEFGVGKTRLVTEVRKHVTDYLFMKGKYAQDSAAPCSAIVSAVAELVDRTLEENDEIIEKIRSKLLSSLGGPATTLIERIPSVQHILGPKSSRESNHSDSFTTDIITLINCISQGKHLCLILDDLQWYIVFALFLTFIQG
jgi:serine/threonine protein kinase